MPQIESVYNIIFKKAYQPRRIDKLTSPFIQLGSHHDLQSAQHDEQIMLTQRQQVQ